MPLLKKIEKHCLRVLWLAHKNNGRNPKILSQLYVDLLPTDQINPYKSFNDFNYSDINTFQFHIDRPEQLFFLGKKSTRGILISITPFVKYSENFLPLLNLGHKHSKTKHFIWVFNKNGGWNKDILNRQFEIQM